MKYLRFKKTDGKFTTDLYASAGDFVGGETAEAEALAVAAHKASLEDTYGVSLTAVIADTDPGEGKALVANPRAAEKAAQTAARVAEEEHEAKIQTELRLMAEERLAAKGL